MGDTSDIISDSSGIGTNSDSAACSIGHPSTTVVCMEAYVGNSAGHIRLQPGDVIDVVGSTDCGLLEGYVRGSNQSGFFPANYVQEVNLRNKNVTNVSTDNKTGNSSQSLNAAYQTRQLSAANKNGDASGDMTEEQRLMNIQNQNSQLPSMQSNNMDSSLHTNQTIEAKIDTNPCGEKYNSATAPRMKKR